MLEVGVTVKLKASISNRSNHFNTQNPNFCLIIKECNDISTTLIVFTSLVCGKNSCVGQDVFNTHGFECTHANIRMLFLKTITTFWGFDLEGVEDS